jgi:malonyl-CoA O-methyltransferase
MIPAAVRPVDLRSLDRVRARLLERAAVPWLHSEVATRMGERLSVVKKVPRRVLDWGGAIGGGHEVIARAYPTARTACVGVARPAVRTRRRLPWLAFLGTGRSPEWPVVEEVQVEESSTDLLWANMVLHGAADPVALLRRWHRALAVDGFLMFSTFGPGTLAELRDLYADRHWGPPMGPLVDMHDLGDMLIEVGFADPVMDQETLELTWSDPSVALDELRSLGGNVDPRRHPGLRTPRWRLRLLEAMSSMAARRADGRLGLTFEIVYGHAFRVAPRPRATPLAHLDLSDMRAMLKGRRG